MLASSWIANYWWTVPVLIGAAAMGVWNWLFGPKPAPSPPLDKLAIVILHQNNMQWYWRTGATAYPIPAEGGIIHKINGTQAQAESTVLQATVPATDPMSVPCALMASESVMDPQCVNENLNGSNPTNDPMGYDCGACQLKLGDISVPGITDYTTALAFAFDVTKAIPYMWGLLQAHLATADQWIAGNTASEIDPRLMNRWYLAVGMFKQGTDGMLKIFQANTWPKELDNFVSLEQWYAQQLGQPSISGG